MPRVIITDAAKRSRVAPLLDEVPRSLEWATPDKVQELAQAVDDLQVLAINGRAKPSAHYYPQAKAIGVTSRLIEVLWCQAYGYELLSERVFAGADAQGQHVRFDTRDDLRGAAELVRWAAHQMAGEYAKPWPNDLPTGDVPAPKAERVANQQALIALAFIIHHELAHHRFGHRGRVLQQEKDADAAAADWLLSDHEPSSQVSFVRARGVSVALLFLACAGVHRGFHGGGTHPPGYQRLVHCLDRHVPSGDDGIWAFVAVMLDWHMQNGGLTVPRQECGGWREWCDVLVDALSRQ